MDDIKTFRLALMIKIRAASRQDRVGFQMIDALMHQLWPAEIHDRGRSIGNWVVRSVKTPDSVVLEFGEPLDLADSLGPDGSARLSEIVKILGGWACSGNGDRGTVDPILKSEYTRLPPACVKSARQLVDWWFVKFGDKPDPVAELRDTMHSPYSIRYRMLQYT